MLLDDAKGVTEALNEKAYGVGLVAKGMRFLLYCMIMGSTSGKYQILFGQSNLTDKRRRAKEIFYEPLLTFFENEDDVEAAELPDPQVNLPDGIHILTLKKIPNMYDMYDDDLILLRLEHIYSKGNVMQIFSNLQCQCVHKKRIFYLLQQPGKRSFFVDTLYMSSFNFHIDDLGVPVDVSPKLIFNGLGWTFNWYRETNLAGNVFTGTELVHETITLQPLEIKTLVLKISNL